MSQAATFLQHEPCPGVLLSSTLLLQYARCWKEGDFTPLSSVYKVIIEVGE
jgi:hypothetical protein